MTRRRRGFLLGALPLVTGLLACSVSPPVGDGSVFPAGVGVMVVESSYDGQSVVEVVDPSTHARSLQTGVGYDADPHVRAQVDGSGKTRVFLVGSMNGTISELDEHGEIVRVVSARDEDSGAPAPNPQDVALLADGTLMITRAGLPSLLLVHPDGARETVDLSSWADADGNPDADAITLVGDEAFVTLRRLDAGYTLISGVPSILVALGTKAPHAARKVAELPPDPFGPFRRRADGPATELWLTAIAGPISDPPVHGAALVRVDATSGAVTHVLDEAAIGGFVDAFDVRSAHEGYAIVASFAKDNPTHLVAFDPTTRALRWTRPPADQYLLWDVQARGDLLFVTDRTKETPNVGLYRASDGSLVGKFATRTLPVDLVLLGAP